MTWETLPLVAAAVAGVLYLCRVGIRAFRRFLQVADTILGAEGQPSLGARLDAIEHELHPNSQLSLRDALDRTEAVAHEAHKGVVELRREVRQHAAQVKKSRTEDRDLLLQLIGDRTTSR